MAEDKEIKEKPIDRLYKEYGQLMVELEIIQAKINSVKQKIIKTLNKAK